MCAGNLLLYLRGITLHNYSRQQDCWGWWDVPLNARIGYSDLGKNRSRMEEIRRQFLAKELNP